MDKISNIPDGLESSQLVPAGRLPRYRRLKRNIIIITCLVAMIPLVILTVIDYFQDKQAFRSENQYQVNQVLSNAQRTLDYAIEERFSVVSLIVSQHDFSEINSPVFLRTTLTNLNNTFGGFIDLGVIDSAGNQINYSGPYDFKGKNYRDQPWFHEVLLRGAYVSDVFLGYRNFPHFVIAVKREKSGDDFFIIRATLDMKLLSQLIFSLELDRQTDAFIVNQKGILQTSSKFYGDILGEVDFNVPSPFRNRDINDLQNSKSRWGIFAHAYIENSPFVLMVIRMQDSPFAHWISHRSAVIWFLVVSVALIFGVVFFLTTNLVRKLREADLRRARVFHNIEYTNKMATIGRMAAGVAHEINNPLAIINEKAGLLKDLAHFSENFPQKEKTIQLVDSVLNSVDRCSKVTHRLLGFARRMDIRKELIDVRNLLEEVAGFQSSEVAHRNIMINFDIDDRIPSIESDRGQLQQIFLNILNNAISAVEDNGKIDIIARSADHNMVSIMISDNGKGIPRENLEHIFEPFFSTKGEFGTGLGLSITRELIEKLGGTIEAQSELNVGTTITVTLPSERK